MSACLPDAIKAKVSEASYVPISDAMVPVVTPFSDGGARIKIKPRYTLVDIYGGYINLYHQIISGT